MKYDKETPTKPSLPYPKLVLGLILAFVVLVDRCSTILTSCDNILVSFSRYVNYLIHYGVIEFGYSLHHTFPFTVRPNPGANNHNPQLRRINELHQQN